MKKSKKQTKSPLKGKPLRYPGQSCDDEINKLLDDKAMPFVITALVYIVLTAYEWISWYFNIPKLSIAVVFTIITIVFIIITVRLCIKTKKEIEDLKLGRDGEKEVGQYLEEIRKNDSRIFHDIIGDGEFNIDHILISTKGIFLIETKTYSKPAKGEAKIFFDGEKILKNGDEISRNPIIQVKASSNWLKKMLLETTGKEYAIKPVIVFPGWFTESTQNSNNSKIWVINPKALPKYIENEKESLSKEDLMLAAYHISRYIRSQK